MVETAVEANIATITPAMNMVSEIPTAFLLIVSSPLNQIEN
jgi:hypothetical protein